MSLSAGLPLVLVGKIARRSGGSNDDRRWAETFLHDACHREMLRKYCTIKLLAISGDYCQFEASVNGNRIRRRFTCLHAAFMAWYVIKLKLALKAGDVQCASHLDAIEAKLVAAVPAPFRRFAGAVVSGPSDGHTWAVTDIYFAADGDLIVEEQSDARRLALLPRGLLLRFPQGRRLQINAYVEYSLIGANSGQPIDVSDDGTPAFGFEVVCCRSPHPELFDDMEVAKRFDLGGCLNYVRKIDGANLRRAQQPRSNVQRRLIEEVALLSEAEAQAATSSDEASGDVDVWDGVSANLLAGHPDQTPVYLAWRYDRGDTSVAPAPAVGLVRYEEAHAVTGDVVEGATSEAAVAVQLRRLGRSHAYMHAILQLCRSWPQLWFLHALLVLIDTVVALSHRMAASPEPPLPSRSFGSGRRARRPITSIAQLDPDRLSLVVHSPDRTRLYFRNVLLKGILRWGSTEQLCWFVASYQRLYDAVRGQHGPLLWCAMEDTATTTFPLVEAVRLGRLRMAELCVAAFPAAPSDDQWAALACAVDLARRIRDVAAERHPQRGPATIAHRIAAAVEQCWQQHRPTASPDSAATPTASVAPLAAVDGTDAAAADSGAADIDDFSWVDCFVADEGPGAAPLAAQASWGRRDGD